MTERGGIDTRMYGWLYGLQSCRATCMCMCMRIHDAGANAGWGDVLLHGEAGPGCSAVAPIGAFNSVVEAAAWGPSSGHSFVCVINRGLSGYVSGIVVVVTVLLVDDSAWAYAAYVWPRASPRASAYCASRVLHCVVLALLLWSFIAKSSINDQV